MQIVQPGLGVIVIPTVTEGIIIGVEVGAVAVVPGNRLVSPCVVGIGSPDTILVTDGKDTTLEITPDLYSTLSGKKLQEI